MITWNDLTETQRRGLVDVANRHGIELSLAEELEQLELLHTEAGISNLTHMSRMILPYKLPQQPAAAQADDGQGEALGNFAVKMLETIERTFATELVKFGDTHIPDPDELLDIWVDKTRQQQAKIAALRSQVATLTGELSRTREALMDIRALTQNGKIERLIETALNPVEVQS